MKLTKEFKIKTRTEENYACHIKVEVYGYGYIVYIVKTYISPSDFGDLIVRRFRNFTVYRERMTLHRETLNFINDRVLHHPPRV